MGKLVHLDVSHNNITGTLPLSEISKIYNRNMTGLFPQGLGELPALRRLEMRDTHLRGSVPAGSWTSLQLLLISGTGGLCGEVPQKCAEDGVHCDLAPGVLPAC